MTKLSELCCATISMKKELYNKEELKGVLPEELYSVCFGSNRTNQTTLNDVGDE